jgi:hypothetical protein
MTGKTHSSVLNEKGNMLNVKKETVLVNVLVLKISKIFKTAHSCNKIDINHGYNKN